MQTHNSTYDALVSFPGWTNNAWINESNEFEVNQNMTGNNITDIDCLIGSNGGKIC